MESKKNKQKCVTYLKMVLPSARKPWTLKGALSEGAFASSLQNSVSENARSVRALIKVSIRNEHAKRSTAMC